MGPLLERHLRHLEHRNLRAGTIEQRRRTLLRLARFLRGQGGPEVPLAAATTDHLLGYLDRPGHRGAEARATEISHLRGFYRWAMLEGHIDLDPTARLVRPRLPRRLPRPIPEGDLAVALDMAPERVRPWLYLAGYAGLRACEIAQLRAEDLWWHQTPALLYVNESKGGHSRTVPVAPVLEEVLRTSGLPQRGWLFLRRDDQPGHVPPWRVSHLSNDFLHDLGLPYTLHKLRHRFGTQFYRASGRDLRLTQEAMGHRSPVSTALYTFVDQSEAAAAVAKLPVTRPAASL